MNRRENTVGVLFLFLTAGCWGFVAPTVKWLTGYVDSYTISFFRVFLASAVWAAIFALQRKGWRQLKWFWPWIIVGALGRSGNYLLYNAGLVDLPSNAATILAPAQTLAVVILARWAIGESVRHKWGGLMLSFAGLILRWWNGQGWDVLTDPRYLAGNVMLILAGVASAFQFTSQKILAPRSGSLEILLPVFTWSTLITAPFAWAAGGFSRPYAPGTWALLLFLGLILTAGSFLLLAEGYKRCAASTAVVITNTTVFFTLIWSRYLLHEPVSAIMISGALLSVAGALAVVQSDRRQLSERT